MEGYQVGIDVGSCEVKVVVGELTGPDKVHATAAISKGNSGVANGVVVDVESTVHSIKQAIYEAEVQAGVSIERAIVGVSSLEMRGSNSRAPVVIGDRPRTIRDDDIRKVISNSQNLHIPNGYQLLHLIIREFLVDGQPGIRNPKDMVASRLEADVHLITANSSPIRNMITCLNRCGIEVQETVANGVAAANAVLSDDEKRLGVALFDIGAHLTHITFIKNGQIQNYGILEGGGDLFTNDLVIGLQTPLEEAERLKTEKGTCLPDEIDEEETFTIAGLAEAESKAISSQQVFEILSPRAEELFEKILEFWRFSRVLEEIHASVVLVGGGARLSGICGIAEKVLDRRVRIGAPIGVESSIDILRHSNWSTAVGLMLHGFQKQKKDPLATILEAGGRRSMYSKFVQWVKDQF